MNVFEAARGVSAVDAAQRLGIPIRRSGKRAVARCVFHEDRTPSMVLYPDGYHCFGCGAHGDAIDLYRHMRKASPFEAAEKLCGDFGLAWDDQRKPGASRSSPRPDPRVLRRHLTTFRQRRMEALEQSRAQAQQRMNAREEIMARDGLPFDEWWDDPEWAQAKADEMAAGEELAQIAEMGLRELWEYQQTTKEETNGKQP